jgi:hypothetical protein
VRRAVQSQVHLLGGQFALEQRGDFLDGIIKRRLLGGIPPLSRGADHLSCPVTILMIHRRHREHRRGQQSHGEAQQTWPLATVLRAIDYLVRDRRAYFSSVTTRLA